MKNRLMPMSDFDGRWMPDDGSFFVILNDVKQSEESEIIII